MTTTSQNLSEIKDTTADQDKKENKEIPSKPTISKRLIYKNVVLPSVDGFKSFLQSASQMWINGHSFSMNNKIGLPQKLKEKLLKAIGKKDKKENREPIKLNQANHRILPSKVIRSCVLDRTKNLAICCNTHQRHTKY
uniref:Uncharacterized protein n=1 Tax=Glossina austeni TaxID=7395 RepID=A0A1A9UI15_GLOAU